MAEEARSRSEGPAPRLVGGRKVRPAAEVSESNPVGFDQLVAADAGRIRLPAPDGPEPQQVGGRLAGKSGYRPKIRRSVRGTMVPVTPCYLAGGAGGYPRAGVGLNRAMGWMAGGRPEVGADRRLAVRPQLCG